MVQPDPIIWVADGVLKSCTMTANGMVAWARHPMGGCVLESVCTAKGRMNCGSLRGSTAMIYDHHRTDSRAFVVISTQTLGS